MSAHRAAARGSVERLPVVPNTPNVRVVREGSSIAIVVETSPTPADEIRPLHSLATEWGLERRGLIDAVRRAGVTVVRIGRERCARRSDVLGMLESLAESEREEDDQAESLQPPKPAGSYAAAVERARRTG